MNKRTSSIISYQYPTPTQTSIKTIILPYIYASFLPYILIYTSLPFPSLPFLI